MNRVLLAIVIFTFFIPGVLMAQSNETIRTGRPGQAIGPYVVGDGYWQLQTGLDTSSSERPGGTDTSSTNSNSVLRVGFGESFELSGLLVFQKDDLGNANTDPSGVSEMHLGFRFNLIDKPDGWTPGLGIQARIKTDMVSGDYRPQNSAPVLILVTQHKLPRNMSWIHNFGINYSGNGSAPTHFWVSNLSFSLSEKWGSFIELYGNENGGVDRQFVDLGFSYLVNNDFQIDVYGGRGKNQGVADVFFSIGVSWRAQFLNRPTDF